LTSDCGEARKHLRLLSDLGEYFCTRVTGDVVGDGEGAKSAGAFCVHAALGDHFTYEIRKFLLQPDILCEQRSARTSGQAVLVFRHRRAEGGGQMSDRAFPGGGVIAAHWLSPRPCDRLPPNHLSRCVNDSQYYAQ